MGKLSTILAMAKTLPSKDPLNTVPERNRKMPAPVGRTPRRRTLPALSTGAAALALLGGGLVGWVWYCRTAARPSPGEATAFSPTEARLLASTMREPNSPRPYLELAEEYAGGGRPASALWAYAEGAARAPADDTIRLKLAAVMGKMGHLQAAEAALRPVAASKTPGAARARQDLAGLLLSTGRPAEALAVLQGAGPEAEALRGRAQEAAGDNDAAAAAYRRAGAAGDPEGYERLARLELASGHLKSAQEAMRSLAGLRSPRPADLLLVAAIHAAVGTPQELDTALARALRGVQLLPRSAAAHEQAGLLFLRKGDRAAALQQFRSAVQLDPNRVEARGRLADLLQAMGQTAGAQGERATYYELKDQPDRALAVLHRAAAAGLSGDLERTVMIVRIATSMQVATAVKEARAGLQRHPGDPQLMLQLGLLYQPGEWRVPLEQLCHDWMRLQPASGMPYWLLGRQAVGDVRADDAIRFLTTACAKEPQRADFCAALGIAYLGVAYVVAPRPEHLASARLWLEKAITLNPQSSGARINLGKLLELTGDLEGARQQYLQGLDAEPGQMGALSNVVQVLTRLRHSTAAQLFAQWAHAEDERTRLRRQLVRQTRNHLADLTARIELARFLVREGELTAAQNQLQRAAEVDAPRGPARRALADVERLLRVQAG